MKALLRSIYMETIGKRTWLRVATQLEAEKEPASQAIARALRTTMARALDSEERVWIDRIEANRREILACNDPLPEPGVSVRRTVGQTCEHASKSHIWALLLFHLIRERKPSCCLELGTCLGISATYQAAALTLNGTGKLVTMEGLENRAAIAEASLKKLGLDNTEIVVGRFQETLAPTLQRCGPVDLAFVDGHHDEHATQEYFRQILPHLAKDAILVFDDISWSPGMKRAWQNISSAPEITSIANLKLVGICTVSADKTGC